jgi:hypothetical protein
MTIVISHEFPTPDPSSGPPAHPLGERSKIHLIKARRMNAARFAFQDDTFRNSAERARLRPRSPEFGHHARSDPDTACMPSPS